MRIAQIAGDLFRLHHAGAPLGERRFLAGLRRELAQLLDRVAQPVGLARGALDLGAMARDRRLGASRRASHSRSTAAASSSSPP